ncbi:hypothetical protein BG004_004509 [Podila humilis]|nr:hypothetical protein BG004_004509 [Podila humilis]
MTNHPKDLDLHDSGGPPAGIMFSMNPDEGDLRAMVATMQDISAFGIAGRIWDSSYVLDAFLRGPSDQHVFTPPCPIPREYFLHSTMNSACSASGNETEKYQLGTKLDGCPLYSNPPVAITSLVVEQPALDPIRIVELGAGTGYVGIALAKRLRPSASLVLTDLEEVMPLLEKNVRDAFHWRVANYISTTTIASTSSVPTARVSEQQQACAKLKVEPLAWGNSSHAAKILSQGRVDYIVASDLVYFPELYPPLLQTLIEISDLETRIIFGYKDREQWKETPFWEQFGRFFEIEVVRIEKTRSTTASDPKREDENEDGEERVSVFGSEEGMFIFVAKKRHDKDILTGVDDTLTTLMMMQIRY